MSANKIAFLVYTGGQGLFDITAAYINKLSVPEGFTIEIIRADADGDDVAAAYKRAMSQTDAKYKVYLRESVFILNQSFIADVLAIFCDERVGIIGMVGAPLLPLDGEMWNSKRLCGTVYHKGRNFVSEQPINPEYKKYWDVAAVDKGCMATQYDIEWNEQFSGDNSFFSTAHSLEFRRRGYKVVVPYQIQPWCLYLHDCFLAVSREKYIAAQQYFLKNYQLDCTRLTVESNYKMFSFLRELTVQEADLNEKAKLVLYSAYFAVLNTGGTYSDVILEKELIKISNAIPLPEFDESKMQAGTVLHVMTEAYSTGGHTRVVERWIRTDTAHRHSVYFTNPRSFVPEWLREAAESSGGQIITKEAKNLLASAVDLYETSLEFEHIVLHIHWQDIIPALAYGNLKWQRKINLLNHADHMFWIGASIVDNIVNLHDTAWEICVKRRGMTDHKYTRLTFPRTVLRPTRTIEERDTWRERVSITGEHEIRFKPNHKIITSMGPGWRFTDIANYDFLQFTLDIVAADPDVIFIVIGDDSPRWKAICDKSNGRVISTGRLDREMVDKIFKITDIYIGSFYHCSGGCVDDAFTAGLPILAMNCDRLPWYLATMEPITSTEVLKERLTAFLKGKYSIDMSPAWKYVEENETEEVCQNAFKNIYAPARHELHLFDDLPLDIQETDLFLALGMTKSLRIDAFFQLLSQRNQDAISQQAKKHVY